MGWGESESGHSAYQTLFELASGGIGRVTLGLRQQGEFERLVAIKRLRPELAQDEDLRRMFLEEARLAGLLRHPHLVPVIDAGQDDEGPYLVMEYVDGVSLSTFIKGVAKGRGRVPLVAAMEIGRQLAAALNALHASTDLDGRPLRLVHRDVSPQNVLIGYDGVVRLLDFGIAKSREAAERTQAGVVKGKRGYLSPEQIQLGPATESSDIFALGIVLFETVAGTRLYGDQSIDPSDGIDSPTERILRQTEPDLGDFVPDAPPELVQLVVACLAKQPGDRPVSAVDVEHALEHLIDAPMASQELRDLMAAHFVDLRQERQERIRQARQTPARPARRQIIPIGIWAIVAVAVAGLVSVGAWTLLVPDPSQPAPDLEASDVDPPDIDAPATHSGPEAGATALTSTAPEPTASAEVEPAAETVVDNDPAAIDQPSRRSRNRSRPAREGLREGRPTRASRSGRQWIGWEVGGGSTQSRAP